jgi:hypothetical protein
MASSSGPAPARSGITIGTTTATANSSAQTIKILFRMFILLNKLEISPVFPEQPACESR